MHTVEIISTGVGQIMEILDSIGIKLVVLAALKEHKLYVLLFCCLFVLCGASVNALQIVFVLKYYKMGDSSDFQRGQIVGAHLAGASVTKTANLLVVSRAAVSKFMMTYTNRGRTSSAKRNSSRKPKLSERNCRTLNRIVSVNHRSTAAKVTVELNNHFEDRFHKNSLTRASQIQHRKYSCNCCISDYLKQR
jgi:predicted transcriptional regulator